jgi:pimeloyl-ACP methyl ester carboxylesterase
MRTNALRRLVVLLAAAGIALGLVSVAEPASPARATPTVAVGVDAPVPPITWTRCRDLPRALCATARVPLDYDDPTGPTILLDLSKVPALEPARRLGTLFVNPGGPGGSAREFAPFAADVLGDTVATRYDVVGIDPRGVGPHSQMVCRTTQPVPSFRYIFPITQAQSRSVWRDGRFLNRACKENPNAIVAHMSTADTARDMDLVRQALGESRLDYYGISYGTYLGAVYAALFPDLVGRFVVDGVLDPVNWATGEPRNAGQPFSTRIRSARGAYEALTSALTECDRLGPRRCPLAGRSQLKWRQMVARAKNNRLTYASDRLRYDELVAGTLSLLYDNEDYSFLGAILAEIYRENFRAGRGGPTARHAASTPDELRERARDTIRAPYAPRAVNAASVLHGVACADSRNPAGRQAWWAAGRAQDRAFPWFGSLWTWLSAPCAGWSAPAKQDAFFGSFRVRPANPILVVGNSFDPATPVQGARRFTTLFEGSRFLLMDGWGHGALGNTCVTARFDAYYARGALPREGAVCPKDRPLFSGPGRLRPTATWRPQAG